MGQTPTKILQKTTKNKVNQQKSINYDTKRRFTTKIRQKVSKIIKKKQKFDETIQSIL